MMCPSSSTISSVRKEKRKENLESWSLEAVGGCRGEKLEDEWVKIERERGPNSLVELSLWGANHQCTEGARDANMCVFSPEVSWSDESVLSTRGQEFA